MKKEAILSVLSTLLLMPFSVSAQIQTDKNATSLQIGKDVSVIDVSTFYVCESLKGIVVDAENEYFASVDGVLFNKDKTELLYYPQDKDKTSYIIPEEVKVIGEGAFKGNNNLEVITLTYGITEIKASAFEGCEAMTDAVFISTLEMIGESAFKDCSKLTNIRIPEEVTKIEENTFKGCSSLQLVTFENTATEIGKSAFSECSALEYIYLPDKLQKINDNTFSNCTMLKDITIPDTVTEIGSDVFLGCDNLVHVFYEATEEKWNEIDSNSDISNILYNSKGMFAMSDCPENEEIITVGENGVAEIKIAGAISPVKKEFLNGTYMDYDNYDNYEEKLLIYSQTPLENAKLIIKKNKLEEDEGYSGRGELYKSFNITTVDGFAAIDVKEYITQSYDSEEWYSGELSAYLWEPETMRPLCNSISFPGYGTGALSQKLSIEVLKKNEIPIIEGVYGYKLYERYQLDIDDNNNFNEILSLSPGEYKITVNGRDKRETYSTHITIAK